MQCTLCVEDARPVIHTGPHLLAIVPSTRKNATRCASCKMPVCDDHGYLDEGQMFCANCVEFWSSFGGRLVV